MTITIHVFGSTVSGAHPAAIRERYGAIQGQGEGLQGNAYAIPVKHHQRKALSLAAIRGAVDGFIAFAETNPHMAFQLSRIGVGAGKSNYTDRTIAPMFARAPANVHLPTAFKRELAARARELETQAQEIDRQIADGEFLEAVLQAGTANTLREEAARCRARAAL